MGASTVKDICLIRTYFAIPGDVAPLRSEMLTNRSGEANPAAGLLSGTDTATRGARLLLGERNAGRPKIGAYGTLAHTGTRRTSEKALLTEKWSKEH